MIVNHQIKKYPESADLRGITELTPIMDHHQNLINCLLAKSKKVHKNVIMMARHSQKYHHDP